LVGEFFDGLAAQFAGAALDGPLDVVLGHADGAGLVDGVAELEVHFRVAAAVPGRDDDRPAQLAELLAPLGVNGPFLVLDRCPVRMPRHGYSPDCRLPSLADSWTIEYHLPPVRNLQSEF